MSLHPLYDVWNVSVSKAGKKFLSSYREVQWCVFSFQPKSCKIIGFLSVLLFLASAFVALSFVYIYSRLPETVVEHHADASSNLVSVLRFENLIVCPLSAPSVMSTSEWNTASLASFGKRHFYALINYDDISFRISGLLRGRSPSAVLWTVPKSAILPVYGGSIRPLSHIVKKCLERISPSLANQNSLRAVSIEIRAFRNMASPDHFVIRGVERMSSIWIWFHSSLLNHLLKV